MKNRTIAKILIASALCFGTSWAQARSFRWAGTPGASTILADLLVTYEDGIDPADIESALLSASVYLYGASYGLVQLGNVRIVHENHEQDPDIIVTNACVATPKPINQGGLCADATTGGYLGIEWWKTPVSSTPPRYLLNANGRLQGSRIVLDNAAILNSQAARILGHELGHYLFGMRDEYEGYSFQPGQNLWTEWRTYLGISTAIDDINRTPLTGLSVDTDQPYLGSQFTMGAIPAASSVQSCYSISNYTGLNSAVEFSVSGDPDAGTPDTYHLIEQIANASAQGSVPTTRWSSMESVQAALNAWNCAQADADPETCANIALPSPYNCVQRTQVIHPTQGLNIVTGGNDDPEMVILLDMSGSMNSQLSSGASRWDVAIDALGKILHEEWNPLTKITLITFGMWSEVLESSKTPAELRGLFFLNPTSGKYTVNPLEFPLTHIPSNIDNYESEERSGATNINSGLTLAVTKNTSGEYLYLKSSSVARSIILISDGGHNFPCENYPCYEEMNFDIANDEGVVVNVVPIAEQLDNDPYGKHMNDAAGKADIKGESCPVGAGDEINSECFRRFLSGYSGDGSTVDRSTLLTDAIREFSVLTDRYTKEVVLSMDYPGIAPSVMLCLPDGGCHNPMELTGVRVLESASSYGLQIDATIYGEGEYKVRIQNTSAQPITIHTKLFTVDATAIHISYDAQNAEVGGILPIQVTFAGNALLTGLNVRAELVHEATGVRQELHLVESSSGVYLGVFDNNLRAGSNFIVVRVNHTENTRAAFMDNQGPANVPQPVAAFVEKVANTSVFITGTIPAVTDWSGQFPVAYTKIQEPEFGQGSRLRLFIHNQGPQTWTGLKARYYFNSEEHPQSVPSFTTNDLHEAAVRVVQVAGTTNLWYAEFDFVGKTLQAGQKSSGGESRGDGIILHFQDWSSSWNMGNDYSAANLGTNWAINPRVNIYTADGVLLSGDPNLEAAGAPPSGFGVTISSQLETFTVGTNNYFTANVNNGSWQNTCQWEVLPEGTVTYSSCSPSITFSQEGAHVVRVTVTDVEGNTSIAERDVFVMDISQCQSSYVLGAINSQETISLPQGVSCLEIPATQLPRSWNWNNLRFQVNSADNQSLDGMIVQKVGDANQSLSGWSSALRFDDPGFGQPLRFRIQAAEARQLRLNWWVD